MKYALIVLSLCLSLNSYGGSLRDAEYGEPIESALTVAGRHIDWSAFEETAPENERVTESLLDRPLAHKTRSLWGGLLESTGIWIETDASYEQPSALYGAEYPKAPLFHPYHHDTMIPLPFFAQLPKSALQNFPESVQTLANDITPEIFIVIQPNDGTASIPSLFRPQYFFHPDAPEEGTETLRTHFRWRALRHDGTSPEIAGENTTSFKDSKVTVHPTSKKDPTNILSPNNMPLSATTASDDFFTVTYDKNDRSKAAVTFHWLTKGPEMDAIVQLAENIEIKTLREFIERMRAEANIDQDRVNHFAALFGLTPKDQ